MAPWQQQQQHSHMGVIDSTCKSGAVRQAGCDAGAGPAGSMLRHAAGSHMPGSFSASLAGLWPLQQPLNAHRSAPAAIRQWGAASCGSSAEEQHQQQQQQQQQQQRLWWLTGGRSPGEELAWLLLDPPRLLPPLPQLLEQALLAPIQERLELVGSQLLSSLMGEWGLLQQLQGLTAVSLLASPTMVEWCDACFAAAEAGQEAKRHKAAPSRPGAGSGAAAAARLPAAGSAGGHGVTFGVDELDVVELELLLHDLVSSADNPDDPLPDPACLHLSINSAALADLRALKQQQLQPDTSQAPTAPAAAAAASAAVLGAAGGAATGGLWGCAAEWAGLSCRHSGSWQLSLLYSPEELARFSMAWRFLVQLRWVRRRLDAARHGGCKGRASRHNLAGQDAREQAAVAAAMQAVAASKGLAHNRAAGVPLMFFVPLAHTLGRMHVGVVFVCEKT
ncbi:hypothetical protein COO60DRAFT_891176 [Scenedesmus sp. NREL 46B-D3]|nr:hypothetical protein COO60DRAFT_891176 [Scenedesmus sp. NREL 46B-D3]